MSLCEGSSLTPWPEGNRDSCISKPGPEKKQGLSYARNAFQIHVHKQDMVKIFLWKECSVYSEDFSVISGHGPFFGEFDEIFGYPSSVIATMGNRKINRSPWNGDDFCSKVSLGCGFIEFGNLGLSMRAMRKRVMCVSQGDNEEGKWKKHWVRTCDLHNLLAEEIDIPGASISKPRECTAKVVGIPAEVCL